jgi:hypothetical protein
MVNILAYRELLLWTCQAVFTLEARDSQHPPLWRFKKLPMSFKINH